MGMTHFGIQLTDSSTYQINLSGADAQSIQISQPVAYNIRMSQPVPHTSTKVTIADTATWSRRTSYIPREGEICVWSDRNVIDGVNYPGIKIGDGRAYAVDLPFAGDDIAAELLSVINDHIADRNIHITPEERSNWLDCRIAGEKLILERNGTENA